MFLIIISDAPLCSSMLNELEETELILNNLFRGTDGIYKIIKLYIINYMRKNRFIDFIPEDVVWELGIF